MSHEPMPPERRSITHRFVINGLTGYFTVGLYGDGRPGEVFLILQKVGSVERGLAHGMALMISTALQHGVPLSKIVEKLKNLHFEPSGLTQNPAIPVVQSLADYLAIWLEKRFLELPGGEKQ